MNLQTPLSRVLGAGSAREGVEHWWWQRLTALALIPLSIWFVVSVVALTGAGQSAARAWVTRPLDKVLLIAFVAALLHHAQLGFQVVIEDYVHHEAFKLSLLLAVKCLAVLAFIWTAVLLIPVS